MRVYTVYILETLRCNQPTVSAAPKTKPSTGLKIIASDRYRLPFVPQYSLLYRVRCSRFPFGINYPSTDVYVYTPEDTAEKDRLHEVAAVGN